MRARRCQWALGTRARAAAVPRARPRHRQGARHDQGVRLCRAASQASVADEGLLALVAAHDTNLPWYLSSQRGEAPSPKAWRKLAGKVDMVLLCLFMVADRVDCPGGWKNNPPLRWFLEEAGRQGVLPSGLSLDPPGIRCERSSGAILVREGAALLIRVRDQGYEIPKGRLVWDESVCGAAARELAEETGVSGAVVDAAPEIAQVRYSFPSGAHIVHKTVHYLNARPGPGGIRCGAVPERTRELRWASRQDLDSIPLVDESLRDILASALST